MKVTFEEFCNGRVNMLYIRRFGCLITVKEIRKKASQFGAQGKRGFFAGCTPTGYRVFIPT